MQGRKQRGRTQARPESASRSGATRSRAASLGEVINSLIFKTFHIAPDYGSPLLPKWINEGGGGSHFHKEISFDFLTY